jgi:hypothetical protein
MIQRLSIAVVVFAIAGSALAANDVVVLRSGEVKSGKLVSCDSDSCTLGKTLYKRDALAWVGFGADNPAPPMVTYNSEDEVHLRNGEIYRGHLIKVDAEKVEIEGGLFERKNVSWLHVVAPRRR